MTKRAEFEELIADRSEPPDFVRYQREQEAIEWRKFHEATSSLSRIERTWLGTYWRDPIHGDVPLKDPLISELIETPAFKRLWNVQQFGDRWAVSSLLNTRPHSRAEHSLGVYALVSDHTDDPAAHAAALLHDAGHTVFSHHGEAVFGSDRTQNWHEEHLEQLLRDQRYGIKPVLDRHGVDEMEVMAMFEHPLLDRSLPDMCADRIDYLLRDGLASPCINADTCELLLNQLRVTSDNRWYFEHPWAADVVERLMTTLNINQYTNVMMYEIKHQTADLLQYGLDRQYLSVTDITGGTDDSVLEKLWKMTGPDRELDERLAEFMELGLARNGIETLAHAMDKYDSKFQVFDIAQKRRAIDPLCAAPGDLAASTIELRPISHWRATGYNPKNDSSRYFPRVLLPPLPYLTPAEREAYNLDEDEISRISGA